MSDTSTQEYQDAYQVLHKEGLLSHQSSVVPNAPLVYENQVMSKLRQGSGVNDKLLKLEQRMQPTPSSSSSSLSSSSSSLEPPSTNTSTNESGLQRAPSLSSSQEFDDGEAKRKRGATGQRKAKKMKAEELADDDARGLSRYDSSLGLLTKKFVDLVKVAEDGILDLNQAADTLSVQKRRIYDITNVLEGIGLIEKKSKNNIQWKGNGITDMEEGVDDADSLKAEIDKLNKQELALDESLRSVQADLKRLAEESSNSRLAYVTYDDLRNLPSMQGQTTIAIKAPSGTKLEVPDPDEGMDAGERRYQIYLNNEGGAPIDVYVISPHTDTPVSSEEWVSMPPVPASPMYQDSMLRLSPPHTMDPDYYFGNMLQGEGVSDLYLEVGGEDETLLESSWI